MSQFLGYNSVPITRYQGAAVPDFQRITIGGLPSLSDSGSFTLPGSGTIIFRPGDRPSSVLTLGSIKDLGAQNLNLGKISQLTGIQLENQTLASFPLLKKQSVGDLVNAVPGLGNLLLREVQPIADLFQQSGLSSLSNENGLGNTGNFGGLGRLGQDITVSQVVDLVPGFKNEVLGKLNLNGYSLLSLEGISNAALGKFSGALSAPINQFLGLDKIPLSKFPIPLTFSGVIGTVDVVYGTKEARRINTISGSDQEGFNVACGQSSCSYIELSGIPYGKQWISGKSQLVSGGFGTLKTLNGGKEPTGRLPFGAAFKVALTKVTESQGIADFGAYFRICTTMPWGEYTCSPYFIGPIPFIPSLREKDLILLGP
ncbi:MAG: hypothetical protein WCA07_00875 [Gloeobacterales cyanobacterium]